MRFKDASVNPIRLAPELLLALSAADKAYDALGIDMVITSLNDGAHSSTSLHYSGASADLRVWGIDNVPALVNDIKERLGNSPDYDVLDEEDHIHIEYQPKRN